MARASLLKLSLIASRGLTVPRAASIALLGLSRPIASARVASKVQIADPALRFVSSSSDRKGITPDGKAPSREGANSPEVVRTPAVITDSEYHSLADAYMERLLSHLELLEQESEAMDVEYSVCSPQSNSMCAPKQSTNGSNRAAS